jgi:hypothetical protein
MDAEERLWNFYVLHRNEWHGRLTDAVVAARLKTYASIARPQLFTLLGRSMDLLFASVRDHSLELYVRAMTANFKVRVQQGISREDLTAALEVGWRVFDELAREAVGDDEEAFQALRVRGLRMRAATNVAFTLVTQGRR